MNTNKPYKFIFYKRNTLGETVEGKVVSCKSYKEAKELFKNKKAMLLEGKLKMKRYESMLVYIERGDECFDYLDFEER